MNNVAILVLGAGELGMAVLRSLAKHFAKFSGTTLTVLLRPSTINSNDSSKQRDLAALQSLGVKFIPGDLAVDSIADLAALFRNFHTVIGCTGFAAGHIAVPDLVRYRLNPESLI